MNKTMTARRVEPECLGDWHKCGCPDCKAAEYDHKADNAMRWAEANWIDNGCASWQPDDDDERRFA